MWCFSCDTCYHISGSNEYGWWFSTEDDTYDPLTLTDVTKGFGESLEVVKTTFNDKVHVFCSTNIKFTVTYNNYYYNQSFQ